MVISIMLWRVHDLHRITKSIVVDKPATAPACIAFDRTGTLLAVACDRIVEVYVLQSREVFVTLEGHLARVGPGSCRAPSPWQPH